MSLPVKAPRTPSIAVAFFVRIALIRAWAYGERTTAMCAIPGRTKSSVNFAWPVIRRGSSRRLIGEPKMRAPISILLSGLGHPAGRVFHRRHDVLVARASAEVALEADADLRVARMRILLEQIAGRHDHSRRAEAALQAVVLPEGLLQGVELSVFREALDGRDVRSVGLDREDRAG